MRALAVTSTLLACSLALTAVAAPAAPAPPAAPAGQGYLRQADLHGDRLVLVAEGDLWLAPARGGRARRLSSHVGTESFPKISPDGSQVAFSALYDGNRDVFVLPIEGGEPRRLTWHPASDEVVGWMPGGRELLFRSRRDHPHGMTELFAVPAGGGDARKLALGHAARLDVDEETGLWAFNRGQRETRTWKRYRGGTATQVWVGHPERGDYRQVTDFDGEDAFPSWHGGRIWFLSDQGGTANIWSMRPDGSDRRRHTEHEEWDARFPSQAPDGRIVYVRAGDLRIFDPATGVDAGVAIDLPSDRVLTRRRHPDAAEQLTSFDLSPDGERLAITTRGEIWSVPVKEGVSLPVTRGSGARESWARFTADGSRLLHVSDEGGEESLRHVDAWGRGEAETLVPPGTSAWHFPPLPSPDGAWVAWADQDQALWIVPAKGGRPKQLARAEQEEIRRYSWSPDGRYLAWDQTGRSDFASILVHDTKTKETRTVTGPTTNDHSPAWDPKGRYLYFLSNRVMNPYIGWRDFATVELRTTLPHALLLRAEASSPFAKREGLPPDEGDGADDRSETKTPARRTSRDAPGRRGVGDESGEKSKKSEKVEPVVIDWEGLADRVVAFPVEAGQLSSLSASETRVFWLDTPVQGMAEEGDLFEEQKPRASLVAFDLEEEEVVSLRSGVAGYDLEAGAGRIALHLGRGKMVVIDAEGGPGGGGGGGPESQGGDDDEDAVSLDDIVIELDPREEWSQIFHEGWRHMRDFHWDSGMGGVDWVAMRDQHARLLPRLATRDDLRDLMGELIGELSTSHTYVWGGDQGVEVPTVPTGLLGADLERVEGGHRIARIYAGDAADRETSPLLEPGVNVKEGELILAVNHRPVPTDRPFLAALQGLAGKPVVLTVASDGAGRKSRHVVVETLRDERPLRYADWVRRNRERVAEATGGRIGYIHVPDMGSEGLVEFDTWFYPQLDKEGMIVDCRWNGGGFVSQLLLERFRRRVVSFDRSRGGAVWTYPYRTLNGPFVVLTNQYAGSDGDIFPRAVQIEELAPVIGMRSWGGVVGIRADKPMVDGGILTQPEFAWWDPVDGWGLENRGVEPDVVVENLPQELVRGVDAQLARGVEEVLRLHAERPPLRPNFGPVDRKDREAMRHELGQGGR